MSMVSSFFYNIRTGLALDQANILRVFPFLKLCESNRRTIRQNRQTNPRLENNCIVILIIILKDGLMDKQSSGYTHRQTNEQEEKQTGVLNVQITGQLTS
jgi:hypothetical protein